MIATWLWGDKFGPDDVAKLQGGIKRNLRQEYRMICITAHCEEAGQIEHEEYGPLTLYPLPSDAQHLIHVKGCFVRLKMFDPAWQESIGFKPGDRLVCVDLDTVITGPLDPLFDRPEPFVIMQGGNAANPCKFNGALMMLRAGSHADVWQDFSLEAAQRVPFYEFPDDQGWIWSKYPDAAGWLVGWQYGVYVFHKPGWPGSRPGAWQTGYQDALPAGARLVTFSGWRTPERFKNLPWVRQHWRIDGRPERGLPVHSAKPASIQT